MVGIVTLIVLTAGAARCAPEIRREKIDEYLADATILYVSRVQFPYEHHNTESVYQNGEICDSLFPERESALKLWRPATGEVHTLLTVPTGLVRDPCVHFSGDKILVSIRWDRVDTFHLYELDLAGRDPMSVTLTRETIRQLTFGESLSDIDPQYLPGDQIVFASTREPKFCMCNRHIMANLHVMNADGTNVLQIGHSTLFEGHPTLLPDGRILYDRWEYVDRNFSDAQGVWTTNPDGTNHALFWGNNTESPAANLDNRVLPGSDSIFVTTMTACHDSPWGAIAVIDRNRGLDGREPILHIWPPEAYDLVGTSTGSSYDNLLQLTRKFEDPWPLEGGDTPVLLASGTIRPETCLPCAEDGTVLPSGVTGLWLLEPDGEMTLLLTDPVGCFDAQPLAATEEPPVIVQRVDLTQSTGAFYVIDVRQGVGMEKVPADMPKYLRVIESPEKRFWVVPGWIGVDRKGAVQYPAVTWNDFGTKRILGEAAIEEDGSVFVEVPADRFVFFQLLDENRQMIQSMRSGVTVRPGETNGCFGCHEDRLATPVSPKTTPLAMRNRPQKLALAFDEPVHVYSYTAEMQPILDRYCVVCHDVGAGSGQVDAALRARASDKRIFAGDLLPSFNLSYWEIRFHNDVNVPGSGFTPKLEPLVWGTRQSRLFHIFSNGHGDETIDSVRRELHLIPDAETLRRVAAWIDLNAPYYPVYSSNYPENPYGRSPLTFAETDELQKLTGFLPTGDELALGNRPEKMFDSGVWFTRPELSPALEKWRTPEEKASAEYVRALALIQAGQARLNNNPRADMPGWSITNPEELRRSAIYDRSREKERRMRQAVLRGEKLSDADNAAPCAK